MAITHFDQEEQREIREIVGGTPIEEMPEVESFTDSDLLPFIKVTGDNANPVKSAAVIKATSIGGGGSGSGEVTGVKGDSESSYRKGNVNITKANIGLGNVDDKSSATLKGEIMTGANVKTALGCQQGGTKYLKEDGSWDTPAGGGGVQQIQSDWNQTNTSAKDYIKNKPTSMPANGGNAATVNSHSVEKDVPSDAVFTDHTYSVMGASGNTHASGLVPDTPTTAGTSKFLREDGKWAKPKDGGNTADVNYDSTNKKITKTIDGTTSDVVTVATLKTDMNLAKGDVGLGNVVNTGDSATPVSGGTTKFTTGGAYTELAKKVDKVAGKGLSTNDYTDAEKSKLSGIAAGAEVNVQSDWNATSGDAAILNKPTIPAAVAVKGDAETSYRTGNVNITQANIGLGNVGNFKAVSTVANQGLSDTEKSNARTNIGAGTSNFSGSYNDLANKPTIPDAVAVKGDAESSYRTGNVNITPANILTKTSTNDGLGHIYDAADSALTTAAFFTQANTVYHIRYSHTLTANVTMPAGCTLMFEGGVITGDGTNKNTITGSNTYIDSDYKCLDSVILAGTIANDEVHLVWIDYTKHTYLQSLVDFAVDEEKDINLDDIELTISDSLFVDRYVDVKNTWMTFHNGTININTSALFKTRYNVGDNPLSQYVLLKDIVFNNSTNAEVDVFYDNHFLRMKAENCVFNNVTLTNTTKYIQSCYVTGCLVHSLEYSFLKAHTVYDIHFINNSVEASDNSDLIFVTVIRTLSVIGNLIESVNIAVRYSWGIGLCVTGNYFEGCHETVIKSVNTTDNVASGTVITGNYFCRDQNDKFVNNKYYFIDLAAAEWDFVIQGNGYLRRERDDSHITQDVIIRCPISRGAYIPSSDGSAENQLGGAFTNTTEIISKDVESNKVPIGSYNSSNLDRGYSGLKVPKTYKASDFPTSGYTDTSIPNVWGARRCHLRQVNVTYRDWDTKEVKTDCYWEATMMDSRKNKIPWTYVKQQLAEPAPGESSVYQTPWIRQMLMIDYQYASNYYLDSITFDDNYYNGLMRIHPSYGLQYWNYGVWSRADGLSEKTFGPTSDRPKLEEHSDYTSTTVYAGYRYFDTTINKPVFFCGYDKRNLGDNGWIDAMGNNPYNN